MVLNETCAWTPNSVYLHLRMLTSWRVFQRQSVTGDRFAVTCYGQGCSRGPEGNFLGPSCQSQSKLWTLAKARRQFFDIFLAADATWGCWCYQAALGTSHVLVVLALVASEVPEGNFFVNFWADTSKS